MHILSGFASGSWRTLTNTGLAPRGILERQSFKDEFFDLVLGFLELAV